MPSIAHLVLGGFLGLALYYISDRKFTKYHVFILFVNNYLGPDVGWVTDLGWISHTVFGFAIFALPLAAIYSYITRFSPDFKRKTLTDLGKSRLPYLNTYCLVLAGGVLHNYLDGVINNGGNFFLFPSMGSIPRFEVTIQEFSYLWFHGALGIDSVIAIVVGIPFIMGFIYYFAGFLKHTPNKAIYGMAAYIGAFLVCYYFQGYNMTFHGDAGAILYVCIFWGFPLGLITASVKIPVKEALSHNLPSEAKDAEIGTGVKMPKTVAKRVRGVVLGRIIIGFFYLIGAILLLGGVGLLVFAESFANWIIAYDPSFWGTFPTELTNFMLFGGLFLVIAGLVSHFAGVKLRRWDSPDFRFVLFHAWLFVSGFVATLVAIGALLLATPGAVFVYNNPDWGSMIVPYLTQAQLALLVQGAGILLGILGILNYLLGVGLLMRSERCRRLTFLYNICWAWSILGLVFACYLNQDDVRAKFQQTRNSESV